MGKKYLSPFDLTTDLFDDPQSISRQDWRAYVPEEIRNAWPELSNNEMCSAMVMAVDLMTPDARINADEPEPGL